MVKNATSIKIPTSGSLVASYRETCMGPQGPPGAGVFVYKDSITRKGQKIKII